jgi:uncharacterized membrane protein YqiK
VSSERNDQWHYWTDLLIPVGAVLVIIFSVGSIFYGPHAYLPAGPQQALADGKYRSIAGR